MYLFIDSPMISKKNSTRGSLEIPRKREILESEVLEADQEGNLISKTGKRLTFASGEVYELGIKERNVDSETEEDQKGGKVIEEVDEANGIRIMIRDKPKAEGTEEYQEVDDDPMDNERDPTAGGDEAEEGGFKFRRHTFAVPETEAVHELIADLQSFGGSGLKQLEGSQTEEMEQDEANAKILKTADPSGNESNEADKTQSAVEFESEEENEPMEAIGEESESEVDINALKQKIKKRDSDPASRRYSRYSRNSDTVNDLENKEAGRKTSHRLVESEMLNQNSFGDIKDLVNTLSQNMDLTQDVLAEESFQMFTDKDQKVNVKRFHNTGNLGFIDAIQVLDGEDEVENQEERGEVSEQKVSRQSSGEKKKADKRNFKNDQGFNTYGNRGRKSEEGERRGSQTGLNVSNLKNETEDEVVFIKNKNRDKRLKVDRNEFDSVHYKARRGKESETEESGTERGWRHQLKGKGVFMSQKDETWRACLNSKIEEQEESMETESDSDSYVDTASQHGQEEASPGSEDIDQERGLEPVEKDKGRDLVKSEIIQEEYVEKGQISLEEMLKRGDQIRNKMISIGKEERKHDEADKEQSTEDQPGKTNIDNQSKKSRKSTDPKDAARISESEKDKLEEEVKDEAIRKRMEEVRQINQDSKPFMDLACQPQDHRKFSGWKDSELIEGNLTESRLKDEYASLRDSDYDLSKSRITPDRRDSDLNERKVSYDPLYRQEMLRNLSGQQEEYKEKVKQHKNLFKDETSGVDESEGQAKGDQINFETHGKGIGEFQKDEDSQENSDMRDELEEYVSEDESKEIDKLDIFASNMDNEVPSKQKNELEHSEVIHESQLKRELDKKYGTNVGDEEQDMESEEEDLLNSNSANEANADVENHIAQSQEIEKTNDQADDTRDNREPTDKDTQQSESLGNTHLLTGTALEFELKYNEILKKTFLRKIITIQRTWRSVLNNKKRDSQGPMDINDIFDRFLTIKKRVAEQTGLSPQERLNLVEDEYFRFLRRLELQNRDKKLLKQLLNSLFFLSKKLEIYPDQELVY